MIITDEDKKADGVNAEYHIAIARYLAQHYESRNCEQIATGTGISVSKVRQALIENREPDYTHIIERRANQEAGTRAHLYSPRRIAREQYAPDILKKMLEQDASKVAKGPELPKPPAPLDDIEQRLPYMTLQEIHLELTAHTTMASYINEALKATACGRPPHKVKEAVQ